MLLNDYNVDDDDDMMSRLFSAQGKAKSKLLSFQEFNNETSDAWGEDDDDVIRVDPAGKKILAPPTRVRTVSGSEVRESIPMNAASELKKLPEQLLKKEEHKTSRPSPLSLLSKKLIFFLIQEASYRVLVKFWSRQLGCKSRRPGNRVRFSLSSISWKSRWLNTRSSQFF